MSICMNMEGNILSEMKSIRKLEWYSHGERNLQQEIDFLGTHFSYKNCIIEKCTRNNYKILHGNKDLKSDFRQYTSLVAM